MLLDGQGPRRRLPFRALQLRLALWQHRLRLDDWRITISYAPQADMDDGSGAVYIFGDCSPNVTHKTAEIRIGTPAEWRKSQSGIPYRLDEIIVHELLHLHFHLFERSDKTAEGKAQEQAIEAIAEALTHEDR